MADLNNEVQKLRPFQRFCCTIGNLPSSYMLSLSYEEQVLWLCDYLEKTVIPTVNNNAEAVKEVQDLIIELKSYMDNYFDNLNIQNEINEKLDTMAQDGTLDNIINQNIFSELNTKINTVEGNLNNHITENQTKFDEVDTSIEDLKTGNENTNQRIDDLLLDKLVVFGDSWSDPEVTDAIWSSNVASALGLQLQNYAKNGAGFIQPTNNKISTQISTFENSSVDKTKVKYIIVMGGINDFRNNVEALDLANEIASCTNTLKTLCPQAKILYVSNCQYPFTKAQSLYWMRISNFISTFSTVGSLNLDGLFGLLMFNSNLFHLTQNGQLLLAKIIVSCLTGGEIVGYRDYREFEDEDCQVVVSTQRINSQAYISVKIHAKNSFRNKNFSVTNPSIPYPNTDIFGNVGRLFNNFIVQFSEVAVIIAGQNDFVAGENYIASCIIPFAM